MRGRIPDHRGLPHCDPRDIHGRRNPRAGPVLHQRRSPRRRAAQSAGDREGCAVRPLLAIRQVGPPSLPRRVPRRHRRRGARGRRAGRRRRRQRPRRPALRARAQRIRRRFGRATGRRAHRLRRRLQCPDQGPRVGAPDGLSRAVDALRAVHGPAGRALEISRAGGTGRVSASRPVRPHARSRVRDLRALDPGHGSAFPREVSEVARRFRRGLQVGDPRQGARHPAWAAAGGDDLQRRPVRHRPGVRSAAASHVRASARGGPRLRPADADRAAPCDPGVPRTRRSTKPRRTLGRLLRRDPTRLRSVGRRVPPGRHP